MTPQPRPTWASLPYALALQVAWVVGGAWVCAMVPLLVRLAGDYDPLGWAVLGGLGGAVTGLVGAGINGHRKLGMPWWWGAVAVVIVGAGLLLPGANAMTLLYYVFPAAVVVSTVTAIAVSRRS